MDLNQVHGYVKLYTIGLWQMMYMDSADDGADDGAEDVHGGPDDGWPMMGTMMYRARLADGVQLNAALILRGHRDLCMNS